MAPPVRARSGRRQSPTGGVDADPSSVELGTRFRTNAAGSVTALRFYKHSQNTGTHVGSLWSSTGTLLAQVTFSGETASGWQVQTLGTPVAITPNTDYVVSYHTSSGFYTGDDGYFAASGVSSGPLLAPQDGAGGSNGLYKYGSGSVFPTDTYNSENYWVDVVFNTSGGSSDTTAPVVTITTPTSATTTTVTTHAVRVRRHGIGCGRRDAGHLGQQPRRQWHGHGHHGLVGLGRRAAVGRERADRDGARCGRQHQH